MWLEINTKRSKLRDFVEKIVKAKLGMNLPLIMHGSALLYEVGDDLEEDMVANYAANLEKVFQFPVFPASCVTWLSSYCIPLCPCDALFFFLITCCIGAS